MKRVILYGGFHNVPSITLRVSDNKCYNGGNISDWVYDNLSEYQQKRLEKHFCGIKGCCCGGVHNVNMSIEIENK